MKKIFMLILIISIVFMNVSAVEQTPIEFGDGNSSYGVLAFSPDGKLLAAAGEKKQIQVWDIATKTLKYTLAGHWVNDVNYTSWVSHLQFSPDSKTLASAGIDQKVKLWNMADGKLIREINAHKSTFFIDYMLYSPDGKSIITSCGFDSTIKKWDVATGKLIFTITGAWDSDGSDISADGKTLITSTYYFGEAGLSRYDMVKGAYNGGLYAGYDYKFNSSIYKIRFSSDGNKLYTLSGSKYFIWDAKKMTFIKEIVGVPISDFSSDGKYGVNLGYYNAAQEYVRVMQIIQAETGKVLVELSIPKDVNLYKAVFSKTGENIAICSFGKIFIYKNPDFKLPLKKISG